MKVRIICAAGLAGIVLATFNGCISNLDTYKLMYPQAWSYQTSEQLRIGNGKTNSLPSEPYSEYSPKYEKNINEEEYLNEHKM